MFNPQPKVKKQKKTSRSNLIKKLDAEFSIFIRTRFSINGKASCFTCDKVDDWNKLQCGHFQSRKHYSTRWDEINCQVQCVGCNVMKYGEQYKFGIHLDQIYQDGTAIGLLRKAKETFKIKDFEIIEKIEYYKNINSIYLHSTKVD
jgi:hypothetical protein